MQVSTQVVRLASVQDVDEILRLARRFVALMPAGRHLRHNEAHLRKRLAEIVEAGAVFVLEVPVRVYNSADDQMRIVGALAALISEAWTSTDPVAVELGWWVDESARGHGRLLLDAFESWADEHGAVPVLSDVTMDGMTAAGVLYERAGYEMVERSWMRTRGI